MAHELEFVNGEASMAYAGDVPWHGLGTKVPNDLTPLQMLDAANLNWTVQKYPSHVFVDGMTIYTKRDALVRSSDNRILDIVTEDWHPVQNETAFEFFNDFIAAGDMEMHTAGSLKNGQIVWALAKIKDSFDVVPNDTVESYLLFSNFHKYGFSTDVRFTPIRVVCNNTLSLSLSKKSERLVKVSHRVEFNPDEVKETLGIAYEQMRKYADVSKYLAQRMAPNEDIVSYFTRVFPVQSSKETNRKEISKGAEVCLDILNKQPGAQYAEGSWWQAFNAVTYYTDHVAGRNADNRLSSSWYGLNKNLKTRALELALEFAK